MKIPKYLNLLAFLILLGALPNNIYAQSDCAQKVDEAYEKYNAGLFKQVIALDLMECLKSGLSFEEKSRVYKVLIMVHLYRDEREQAETLMEQLFEHDPEYGVDVLDPIEFENLHKRFDTDPIGMLEVRTGINLTYPIQGNAYMVGLQGSQDILNYPKPGTTIGVFWEQPARKGFSLSLGVAYTYRAFSHQESMPYFDAELTDGFDIGSKDFTFELTFDERQHWVEVPLSFNYNFMKDRKDKLVPFFSFGATGHYLLDAKFKQLQRTLFFLEDGKDKLFEKRIQQTTTTDENIMAEFPLRNRLNLSGQIGGGLQIKIDHNYLSLGLQLVWMTRNQVNSPNRFSNQQLIYTYGYVDDDFIQVAPQFNVGFKHIFYNPQIRKTPKPKRR